MTIQDLMDKYTPLISDALGGVEVVVEHYYPGTFQELRVMTVAPPKFVGLGQVGSLPGNGDLCISSNAHVNHEFRHKGIGDLMHKMRLEAAKLNGYKVMICTALMDNEAQTKILRKNGWTAAYPFRNHNKQDVLLWVKEL